MRFRFAFAALCALMLAAPLIPAYHGGVLEWQGTPNFNGVGSYAPAAQWDAPIFRQFAFVEGVVTQYHVLTPETFLMDSHHSHIYQFPACVSLDPVLEKHYAVEGDGGMWGDHDAPTRRIVNVALSTGCLVQPRSVADIERLAVPGGIVETELFVNAPVIPRQLADLPDDRLFNGPSFRPRVQAWQEGVEVKFITYEASWYPTWTGINWPGHDADVFMISYGAMFRPGWTILNTASGTPHHSSLRAYSPMWVANCVVDVMNPKCMVSVNLQSGYRQCFSVADCLSMTSTITGLRVDTKLANTFTHINCPMVAVDLNNDHYIQPWEELVFPNLWVNGPVVA